ncbi:Patatin-like phospholipase domain-containing protein [Seminavis robusta]|uniref:Patatin-like phospholipase domain-containing protein n=1 Tax=Seminavis robusta TaxID=568900 RepID=A0A9N8HN89_9STRA|nr:Patatin-like phospholipase domain-containing protein [Seminavis robusta]|eukprot:Sro970_g226350.1 Patatin-like phospholipase domain-containing protein (850) ;mRNA; r:19999-23178
MSAASSIPDYGPQMELVHQALDEVARFLIANAPTIQEWTLELMDTIFMPRTVARQLALAVALDAGLVTVSSIVGAVQHLLSNFSSRSRLIRQLKEKQEGATTQDEWIELALKIDNVQGNDVWRSDPNCPLYERERISARVDEFVHLMRRRDIFELMFVLRGGIARNKFGLLHEGLFSKALAGTKVLVETYHNVVCAALDFVCDAPVPDPESFPIPTEARLAFFNETRHAYGRSSLLLSGGAALGFYHAGVVKALMENHLMPRVIGGSSAGSIVCAMVGTRTDEECLEGMLQGKGTHAPGHSGNMNFNFFRPMPVKGTLALQDPKRTWQVFVPIGLRTFTSVVYDVLTGNRRPQDAFMNDTNHFRNVCKGNIGNFTFQEAFDRTGRILNIVVTPKSSSDPPRLLNYLTAPHVMVWSAAVASSSLPGVFEANRLMVKDADGTERYESAVGMQFSDGSMENDLPMQQLSEMFNVNHFIISQANPHAVMFASYNQERSVWVNPVTGMLNSLLIFCKDQVRAWLSHLVELVGGRRIAPLFATQRDIGAQFFTQEYEGRECDISLIPWKSHRGLLSAFLHCLYNPTLDEFHEWVKAAEAETWKHIPAIKSHIAEEVTLDRCVQRLRKRIVSEAWAKKRNNSGVSAGKMGERVPSFFTSPSLVNLSGLGISDQTKLGSFGEVEDVRYQRPELRDPSRQGVQTAGSMPESDIPTTTIPNNHGWGGLGLNGNRSSGSLNRIPSTASGLFIDGDDEAVHHAAESTGGQQIAGEVTKVPSIENRMNAKVAVSSGYFKTTTMAHFYYRNTSDSSDIRKSVSDHEIIDGSQNASQSGSARAGHGRRKSQSQGDLNKIMGTIA